MNAAWGFTEFKRRACFTIPIDEERDADCIIDAVITERDALREAVFAYRARAYSHDKEHWPTDLDSKYESVLDKAMGEMRCSVGGRDAD